MLYHRYTPRPRLIATAGAFVTAAAVAVLVDTSSGASSRTPRAGGTFRVSMWAPLVENLDPALAGAEVASFVDPTCARLMRYRDQPPPAGFRLVPDVAVSYPRVSKDMKTFTFTLRRNFRFSNGTPVRASAFARAIARTLAPGVNSPGSAFTRAILGAEAVLAGRRKRVSGVNARGNRLVIRFTRPVPDFPAQTTMTYFCAVPPSLPATREGVGAFPAAGPYYVAEFRPRERIVLRRNRYYGGTRPHHVDRFVVDLTVPSREAALDQVERGQADWTSGAPPPVILHPARGLVTKFGVNKSRFFVKPGLVFRHYLLNASRPLFRNNARLRRAVNYAIDRSAQLQSIGGPHATTLSDQYLPPSVPGFRDVRIYPMKPNVARARALARGATRGGKAVLYTRDNPPALALAQLVKRDLASIGLDIDVTALPAVALDERLARAGEPWDIGFDFFAPQYVDPYAFLNVQFHGRFARSVVATTNRGRFDSPAYNRRLSRAARLRGAARYRAYGKLDVDLARNAAPVVGIGFQTMLTLVSPRVGCVLHRPEFVLTVACLKR